MIKNFFCMMALGAGADHRAAGHAQGPDRLDGAGAGLGDPRRASAQRGAGGGFGVDGVGLADQAAGAPVGAVDLDDLDPGQVAQVAGQACAVGAGALDTHTHHSARIAAGGVGGYPLQQVGVPGGGGGEGGVGQHPPGQVDHRSGVGVGVGVDPADDLLDGQGERDRGHRLATVASGGGPGLHGGAWGCDGGQRRPLSARLGQGRHAPAERADKTVTGACWHKLL